MIYRPATTDDIARLYPLVNRAFRGDASGRGWTHEAELLEGERIDERGLRERIEGLNSRIEVAVVGDELVACAHLLNLGADCYLGMLSVDPSRQEQGVGKALLAHCEELALTWGCIRMQMTVIDLRTELIAFYQRRGYALTGEREPFPSGFGQLKVAALELLKLSRTLEYSSGYPDSKLSL